jgi:hypothetical protein
MGKVSRRRSRTLAPLLFAVDVIDVSCGGIHPERGVLPSFGVAVYTAVILRMIRKRMIPCERERGGCCRCDVPTVY